MDVIGFSLVTIGARASVETQKLFEGGEYTKYLYLHGFSVETTEVGVSFGAGAEYFGFGGASSGG